MAAPKWHERPMVGFDTETTGTDPLEDRIITAAAVYAVPGDRPRTFQWILNPGVDVPAEAAAVHGWTTEALNAKVPAGRALSIWTDQTTKKVIEKQVPISQAFYEMAGKVGFAIGQEYPVVGMNLPFDLTFLEAENVRNAVPTLSSRPKGITGIVDVRYIEKQYDQFRKHCYKAPGCRPEDKHHECGGCRGGKYACGGCGSIDRKLTSLCAHYGIRHTGAHAAAGDALATIRLAQKLAGLWPAIARFKLETLHSNQVEWCRSQTESFREWKLKKGDPVEDICPEWPVHAACVPAKAVA